MSLDFDIEYPMQSLYIAKIFYDHNRLDTLLDCLDDDITISWDELSQLEQTAVTVQASGGAAPAQAA